jgi:AcrR family transcriptional regulator
MTKPVANQKSGKTPRSRARSDAAREAKRQVILDAALDVFAERGFANARLEDVAARAGVAKGTVYLYVSSKEALFEELVRTAIAVPVQELQARVLASDMPTEALLRMLFAFVVREVLGSKRREIVRLVLSEANRFPDIAALYHREVISRGLALMRQIVSRAVERGEFMSDEVVRFPHLVFAPALVALVWKTLFDRFDPLDAAAMLDAHVTVLMRAMRTKP